MGFDKLKTPDVTGSQSESKDNTGQVSFDTIIDSFEKGSFALQSKVPILKRLRDTLSSKNEEGVILILKKLSKASSDNISEINGYISSLEEISKKYQKQKIQVTDDTGVQERSMVLNVGGLFFDSNSLNEIQGIVIDGKVEDMDEFNRKLGDLIRVINNDPNFQKLDPGIRSKIISGLERIGTGLEQQKNKTLAFLDNKINSLAEQIESQSEGVVSLTIEGETVTFNSKEEAFLFIKTLKEEAEWEFQSFMTDLYEFIGSTFLSIFSIDLPLKPYIWTKDSLFDAYDNYKDNEGWFSLLIDGIQFLFLTIITVNYNETIYRRIVRDTLGKMGIKKYKLGEFNKTRLDIQPGESKEESSKKQRYNRRLDAYAYLRNNLSQISPENRTAYLKELKNIESYINIDSRTFWLKFEALRKEKGLTGRVINVFKYGPKYTFYDIERSEADYINSNHDEPINRIKEGLGYVFDSVNVSQSDNGSRTISVGEESKNIKSLKDYIDTIEDSSRRKTTLDNLNKFLASLKTEPMSVDDIKGQLYNIIENNYYDKDNIVNEINKKYFKNVDVEDLERRGFFKWFLEKYDSFKGSFGDFNKHMVEVWGKYAPTSLTSGQALAIKWREAVKNGRWEGNLDEIELMFAKIDSGKLEFNNKFPGLRKFAIPFHLVRSLFGKYGIEMPSISNLDKYGSSIKNKAFEDILEKGSAFGDLLNEAKKIFSGELGTNLLHVFNLDSSRFPPEKEKFFEEMYKDFKDLVEAGNDRLTPDQVKLEFVKMYNGYLTNNRVLSKLRTSFTSEELKSDILKDFIKKVETGKWIGTLSELKNAITELKSGTMVPEKVVTFDLEAEIKKINDSGAKLKEIDFSNVKFGIFEPNNTINTNSYMSNEFELVKLLRVLGGDSNTKNGLGVLFQKITQDNINYTSVEFFEELNKALGVTFSVDENTTRSSYNGLIVSEIEPKLRHIVSDFEGKDIEGKKLVVEELKKVLGVSSNNLISKTTTALENAGFNIGLYTDKISAFESEKKALEAREAKDVEKSEESRRQIEEDNRKQVKAINEQIRYLKALDVPITGEDVRDVNSDLSRRGILISLESSSGIILIGSDDPVIGRNKSAVEAEINRLESEKFKIEDPKSYFVKILDEIHSKLVEEGVEPDILDDEYNKINDGTDIAQLIKDGKIDDIFNMVRSSVLNSFYSQRLDTRIVTDIFEAIKKKGFSISR